MNKIIILVGISGSGKSTFAKNYVETHRDTVIISRDSIRMSLFGFNDSTYGDYYNGDITAREKTVTEFFNSQVWNALEKGYDVICDNTHLNMSYINVYKMFSVPLEVRVFDTNIDLCVQRDFEREKSVGIDVVMKQYKQFEKLLKSNFKEDIKEFNNELINIYETCKKEIWMFSKPDCVVFDLDGTLCHTDGNRSPYEYTKVGLDRADSDISELADIIGNSKGLNVIICTGRDNICREETFNWLKDNCFKYEGLYMRKAGDKRKDNIVKPELWREIQKKFNIISIVEDRKRVVNIARKLGYKCLQVENGDF